MKAKMEDIPVQNRGVEIESETEEEKAMLESIWINPGRPVMLNRKPDGHVQLVITPTIEGG